MISFSKLGRLGRLGNQLFQYAYLRSQANRLGVRYSCPTWIGDDIFNLNESNRVVSSSACLLSYLEPKENCGFNRCAVNVKDNTDVCGFFQTPKYSSPQALKWFKVPERRVVASHAEYVGIHIRFGDYTNLAHVYPAMTDSYYQQAFAQFPHGKFLVFSDDLTMAKSRFAKFSNLDINYYQGNSDLDDFFALASCGSHIICNSSFSWWAAYLSQTVNTDCANQVVKYPSPWFTPTWITSNHTGAPLGWNAISNLENDSVHLNARNSSEEGRRGVIGCGV